MGLRLSALALLLAFSVTARAGDAAFRPGQPWLDNHGVSINAHAGGVLVHEGDTYWVGQQMIAGRAGNAAHDGVPVYSSR